MTIARPNWWRLQAAPSNQRGVKSCRVGDRHSKNCGKLKVVVGGVCRVTSLKGRLEERGDAPLKREEERKDDSE